MRVTNLSSLRTKAWLYLTRTYTGANEGAGLGQDVIAGGTSDKATKEAIANISLNEGSSFAGSASSATDGDLLNLRNPDIEGTGQKRQLR